MLKLSGCLSITITLTLITTIHAAPITDFHAWNLVEDPPRDNLSSSIDSPNQVTLTASGSVPDANYIGYQSLNGNSPSRPVSGFAFDPTTSFSIAIDYDWSLQNAVGGSEIGFAISEYGERNNTASVQILAWNNRVLLVTESAQTQFGSVETTPLIDTDEPFSTPGAPPPMGSLHLAFDAESGDITVGSGMIGSDLVDRVGILSGDTVYNLWNAEGDIGLLSVSLFLRSQQIGDGEAATLVPQFSSGLASISFSNFRVISGSPVAIPEPALLGLSVLTGFGFILRRVRV